MIRFDNVTKTYQRGHAPAVEDLTIEFERGEFVFLVGASGSGKSTVMRLVLKETSPTRGNVYVAGKDLARIPSWRVPTLRRDIGMVFQDFRLLPSKTAYENIEFALAVIGTPRKVVRRLVPEMLEMVGLEDKGRRMPHELSGGEQQRVAIARAYVNRPSILLADEPTGNLDPATAKGILDLLAQINDRGTTVVMATHDRSAVDSMRKRVVEMVGGHVVRDEESGGYESASEISVISGNLPDGAPRAGTVNGETDGEEQGGAAPAGAGAHAASTMDTGSAVRLGSDTQGVPVVHAERDPAAARVIHEQLQAVRRGRRGRRAAVVAPAGTADRPTEGASSGIATSAEANADDAAASDAAPLDEAGTARHLPSEGEGHAEARAAVGQARTGGDDASPWLEDADHRQAAQADGAVQADDAVQDDDTVQEDPEDALDEDLYDERDALADEDAAAFQDAEDDPEAWR